MRLTLWLVVLPLAIFSAFFAVHNRQAVNLDFDPFPYQVQLPVFVAVLGAILIGLIAGGIAAWLRQGKWRRQARTLRKKVRGLESDLEQVRAQAASITLTGAGDGSEGANEQQTGTGG